MADEEAARYLAILGLTPGASLADIKQAYRDLVNVWHPDRFAHHPRLQTKAEENLKQVNAAYAWLVEHPEELASPAGGVHRASREEVRPTVRRPRLEPVLLVVFLVGASVLAGVVLQSRRRAAIVAPAANQARSAASGSPKAAESAPAEAAPRNTSGPPRWPWRGVTFTAAGNAAPADVGTLVTLLGPHFNYVRLTLDGRTVAERKQLSAEAAWSASLEWADAMLEACRTAGVVATVALNQVPLDPEDGVTETSAEFWKSSENLTEVVRLAGQLAEHFRERGGELGGYEVLPKPFVLEGNRPTIPEAWPSLLRRIVAEIRRHDAGRWIVVTPGPGGLLTGYRNFAPLDDPRIVYAANVSMPSAYTHQGLGHRATDLVYPGPIESRFWDEAALTKAVHALRDFQVRYRVPVLIDEFGCVPWAPGRGRYLSDLASLFGTYRWGWAYLETHGAGASGERWKELQPVFARFGADPPA